MGETDGTSSLDRIHIYDLLLRCIIGINPDERVKKQDVRINITVFADLSQACRSDEIEDTVDYRQIQSKIVALVEGSSFHLIERMAECIAETCLEDKIVKKVQVLVKKPRASRLARSVGVEICRFQKTISGDT